MSEISNRHHRHHTRSDRERADDNTKSSLPHLKRDGLRVEFVKVHRINTQDSTNEPIVGRKTKYLSASEAINYQIKQLQREVLTHMKHQVDEFNDKEFAPLAKQVRINLKNTRLVEESINEQEKLMRPWYTINANGDVKRNIDDLNTQLKKLQKTAPQLEQKCQEAIAQRNQIVEKHRAFLRYLDYGSDLIKKEVIFLTYDPISKIRIRRVRPGHLERAFSALASVTKEVNDDMNNNYEKELKHVSTRAKAYKSLAKDLSESTPTGFFDKGIAIVKDVVFATDGANSKVIEDTEKARFNASISEAKYTDAIKKKINLSDKFKDFLKIIYDGEISLRANGNVSFDAVTKLSNGDYRLETIGGHPGKFRHINISLKDQIIATTLGLNPEIVPLGAPTRSFEGATDKSDPHYEGKIIWPSYSSGITVGGYDFGYKSKTEVRRTLHIVDSVLEKFGKEKVPQEIKDFLIKSANPKYHGHAAKKLLNHQKKHCPEISTYKFEPEACTVFFLKYFSKEFNKARRIVNNRLGIKSNEDDAKNGFSSFPLEVQQLITDTVVRGDFAAIVPSRRNSEGQILRKKERSNRFWNAVKNGANNDNWVDLAEIYKDRSVFILNPHIKRHAQRAEIACLIDEKK